MGQYLKPRFTPLAVSKPMSTSTPVPSASVCKPTTKQKVFTMENKERLQTQEQCKIETPCVYPQETASFKYTTRKIGGARRVGVGCRLSH